MKLNDDIEADRKLMLDLMETMKQEDLGVCNSCGQEGIILKSKDVEACWVCVKNGKVKNTTGFLPDDADGLEKLL